MEVLIRAFNEFDVSQHKPASFQTFSQARVTVELALRCEPKGVWAAISDRGKIVGVCVGYRRGDYVSIGPVAVHPLVQGQGVGRRLMMQLLEEHTDARWMILSHAGGNLPAFLLYRTLGFRVLHADAGFSGPPAWIPPPPDGVSETRDLERVLALDRELTGVDRGAEIEMLARMGRVYVHDGGYLLTVPVGPTLAVGPGAAHDGDALASLMAAAVQDLPTGGLTLRAPANGRALDVLVSCGLRPQGLGNTMVWGSPPERPGEYVYPVFPELL